MAHNVHVMRELISHARCCLARGRARALPFLRKPLEDVRQPPPAAVIYMDFAGPLLASIIHRCTCYDANVVLDHENAK